MQKTFLFTLLGLILMVVVFPTVTGAQGGSTSVEGVFGQVKPPSQISVGDGASAISVLIQRVIQLIYTVGAIGFIFMLIWSGLQMILNAGDKEAVGTARKRVTTAIIGIALLALAFPILRVLEGIIGIKFFF